MTKSENGATRIEGIANYMRQYWHLYLLILPAVVWTVIFCYWPMYGVQIAFKDFSFGAGIAGSEWVGFEHFQRFFDAPSFYQVLRNTIGISLYGLIVGFPLPIILALMLNELRSRKFKKSVQMITYMPYFISTVAVSGMILLFLKKDTGVINALISAFGGERTEFIAKPEYFWSITVWSGVWQGLGWASIIYIAALSGVNPELVEAAKIDGASRFQKIRYVDIPAIMPTIIILLILDIGTLLSVGAEKVLLLQNSLNLDTSEVIGTYVYRIGILGAQYDYSAAIGLFNSLVNVILLIIVNAASRRISQTSLW